MNLEVRSAFGHGDSHNHVPGYQVDPVIAGDFDQDGVFIAQIESRLLQRRIRQLPPARTRT